MKTFNDNVSIADFQAWSGAISTKETILKNDKENEFNTLIEEIYPDGLSETQLNDILWFESDWIYEMLGLTEDEENDNE